MTIRTQFSLRELEKEEDEVRNVQYVLLKNIIIQVPTNGLGLTAGGKN